MNATSRAKRNFWAQTGSMLLLSGLMAAAYIGSATRPISKEELAIETSDLRSLSAEGAELSAQLSSGKLTDAFFFGHVELMHDKIATARETLESPNTDTEVPLELDKARRLAERIDGELEKLSADEHYAGQAKQGFTALVEPLRQLEDELKQGAEK